MIIYQSSYKDHYNSGEISRMKVISKRNSKGATTRRKKSALNQKNSIFLKKLGFKVKKKSSK